MVEGGLLISSLSLFGVHPRSSRRFYSKLALAASSRAFEANAFCSDLANLFVAPNALLRSVTSKGGSVATMTPSNA